MPTRKTSITRLAGGAVIAATAVTLALVGPGAATAAPKGPNNGGNTPNGPTIDIQLLSFNDFHGNLEPPVGSSGRLNLPGGGNTDSLTPPGVGGVEYLATHLAQAREGHRYSLTVAAGDLIGASPLLSGAFHDEPSIEALNALHLDVSAVGNHEFDEGYIELQRMADGGCLDDGDGANNQNSCPDGSFDGADFDFLAANVVYEGTDQTILPAYSIENIKGAKIGFIGMTLEETPDIVTAAGVAGLDFKDEVETANALVPVLKAQGVNAIVVLIHQGGTPPSSAAYNAACGNGAEIASTSPIIPIAKNLDPAIDLIVSGHTHAPYICNIKDPAGQDRLVTSASSFGRLYTDTNLTYDRRTQDIVRTSVTSANMLVTRNVDRDPVQTDLIAKYKELVKPIASEVIGSVTADITRAINAGGESALGDLIADAQLADPSVVGPYAAPVIALMNPGGIRTDLTYAGSSWGEAPGQITYEEAFNVQPFNNYLVSLDLTGAEIKTLLSQQWSGANAGAPKILQVSEGFSYTYSGTTLGQVTLNGVALDDTAVYRVVTNNFLAGGGDGFPAFLGGDKVYYGGLDIDAFAAYLTAHSPYAPTPLDRIIKN
ncbi:bifunctional metallophosphatase/5'-nucleotidase [Microbacterium sp. M3]|uniref:Bifunctional metallophosphatase/5'-nucleotidase n=1 Tax=Microbacterium arthrosphaerae TaxID=792652 RepID=A0ABU4GWK9_9MICO|nr:MULTISPECIES: bifunctional metallophosphatase/5'-nucleotidase [Microbacterium]MDW4571450.1 bifunctional metallophosphatase/5'-nucleotidase [Microbacterium arthrosphaerae]MDW7605305.1 bifunctional metallophosphatase/5'-nucleotidase [Microbacterium sp. M3]